MAPAAKRKKPGEDDQSIKAAPKPRAKKQKTDADPAVAIETPPPTPKPTPAARGRKPNATKAVKANGNGTHAHANGNVPVALGDLSASRHEAASEAAVEAPNKNAVPTSSKRKVVPEDEEDEHVTNGQVNGLGASLNGGAVQDISMGSEIQTHTPTQGLAESLAKDATSIPQITARPTLEVPNQPLTNGHTHSASAFAQPSDPQNVRPSTERPTSNLNTTNRDKAKQPKPKSKDAEMRDRLYQYTIKAKPVAEIWSVEELKKAGVTQDDTELIEICNHLVKFFLFSQMTIANRALVYKTRSYEVAKKLALLSENNILIYSLIENAGGAGAWLRPLESKSNLHTSVVRKCLKELIQHKVITEIKSADTSRKTYISSDTKPDEKHVGGGFIDEGKFDLGMIDSMIGITQLYLTERGWHQLQGKQTTVGREKGSPTATKHKSKTPASRPSKSSTSKDAPAPIVDIEDATHKSILKPLPPRQQSGYHEWTYGKHKIPLVPQHPDYYSRYPTTMEIMLNINEKGVLNHKSLTLKDAEQLLDMMAFDGIVERMRDPYGELNMKEPRWRSAKHNWDRNMRTSSNQHFGPIEPQEGEILPGNGLSQVPCARCPVKAKCKPGGVVSPEECKYLGEWLAF